ncbi:AAA family ATPase [Enterobacter asburiae]|uniref:AAA family ATPase n=1 Tax=Enterobacter asburiae TaxID=61645 RepID=UPI00034C64CA|nr:AAA family ATPase [Enterobacter asburiae]MBT1891418.1 AAA family ATPase [Enterobacter asburiae]
MKENFGLSLVKTITIKELFGLYSYTLNSADITDGTIILYGDNGVGKSTILRLVFDLLSTSDTKGHRTALLRANFKYLEVVLKSNVKLTAERKVSELGRQVLILSIIENNKLIAIWNHSGKNDSMRKVHLDDEVVYLNTHESYEMQYYSKRVKKKVDIEQIKIQGESNYMEKLRQVVPLTFILNADRRLDGDSISDGDEEVQYRQIMRYGEPKSIQDLVIRSREIALTQALSVASKWISRKAVLGTNQGADNVHSTYIRILKHIVYPKNDISSEVTFEEVVSLNNKIKELGEETNRLAKYELATALDMSEFTRVLQSQKNSNSSLSIDLLKPYIESLDVRLQAVRSIYITLDKFITIINELLTDKEIGFHLSQGFYIRNKFEEPLTPAQLSSGEQQLLLLFCNVLVARDNPSLFIIDEPEISLNIKWQRKLVNYLLDLTEDSRVQFMFASHSLEIISQHRHRVVKLVNEHE